MDWSQTLNDRLQSSIHGRYYEKTSALVLYWQDGHKSYRDEARLVTRLLQEDLQYPVVEFPIPSSNSYAELMQLITRTLIDIGATSATQKSSSSLLIIHYGGHGDKDDDRHAGQERRSVWAAHEEGEPTLKWYMIQDQLDQLKTSSTDILLLLDCCFAAQAGRAREEFGGRLEILAASAMGMKTPAPGDTSFTNILLQEMRQCLDTDGFIDVKDLHGRLCRREANLFATPFYMALKPRHPSIKLYPLKHDDAMPKMLAHSPAADRAIFHQFLVQVESQLTPDDTEGIVQWLGTGTPSNVSNVIFQTTQISSVVQNMEHSDSSILKELAPPSKTEILTAWDRVVELVEAFRERQTAIQDSPQAKSRKTNEFLKQLNALNQAVRGLLEYSILCDPGMQHDAALQEAINDSALESLGVAEQLRLRQMVLSTTTPRDSAQADDQSIDKSISIQEYKEYGPYVDPTELPSLSERVRRLAEILGAHKSPDFRSLTCFKHEHHPDEHKYVLHFSIPKPYQSKSTPSQYDSLYTVMKKIKGPLRPSLDARLRIASQLSGAIRKWHSVGWVHQGVSSHNVVFFRKEGTAHPDYLHPFLQGFELARPDSDPSIGRPMEDVAFNIYRHPSRQGTARRGHRKVHDIYSLGVVLLEIGLWQAAVDILDPRQRDSMSSRDVRKVLQAACDQRLAHYAGESYQKAVSACLGADLGVDVDDEQGTHLGAAFKHKVIDRIDEGVGCS